MVGTAAKFLLRGKRPVKPALARLSQSVDRLIEALTASQGASEAELNALADRIDAALSGPAPAPVVVPVPVAAAQD